MSDKLKKLKDELKKAANPKQAKLLQGFFKTGKGQYGEGDIFLGIKVPVQRAIVKKYGGMDLKEIQELLNSKIHEYRLIALFILIKKYIKSSEEDKGKIYRFYLKNTKNINNWDLVDLSAPNILGDYLLNKNKKILLKLVKSNNLWERRIAIISTYTFIRHNQFNETLKLARKLLKDDHDLIHKAVGWMLREVGNKDQKVEKSFLNKYYQVMPRTMLRYAIEKFNKKQRSFYMKK